MMIPIEDAPPKRCFVSGDSMFCSWVRKGDFALMADGGGYIKFPLSSKTKTPSEEEEVEVNKT